MRIYNDVFVKNLRFYLSERELSQAELSRRMGVSTATVSDWCNGNKMPGNMQTFQKLASVLGIELADLLEDETTRGQREQNRKVMLYAKLLASDELMQIAVEQLRKVPREDLPKVLAMINIFTKKEDPNEEKK